MCACVWITVWVRVSSPGDWRRSPFPYWFELPMPGDWDGSLVSGGDVVCLFILCGGSPWVIGLFILFGGNPWVFWFILNGGYPWVLLFVYSRWGKPMSVVVSLYSMGETHECECMFILYGGNPWVLIYVYTQWGKPTSGCACMSITYVTYSYIITIVTWSEGGWGRVRTYVFRILLQ